MRLCAPECQTLRGMAAASGGLERESYEALADAVGEHGEIEVWAEF